MSDFNINEDAQTGEFPSSQSDEPEVSQPCESAFPDEDEDTITMLDVIEREDKLEEEASAVLGNSDEKNCTYPKGYIPRQALYSCATCSDGPDKLAAICLACSLECHDNHEVYELYTKRNYRCDCGNSKFKSEFECKLMDKQQKKAPLNESNKYNHNFTGRYCICDKRYPPDEADDSAESQDEMWQCIVCEDWYHTKHLGTTKELPTRFDELICGQCVDKLDFVHYYRNLDQLSESKPTTAKSELGTGSSTTVEAIADMADVSTEAQTSNQVAGIETKIDSPETKPPTSTTVCESDTNDSQAENKDPGSDLKSTPKTPAADECVLEKLKLLIKHSDGPDEAPQTSTKRSSREPLFWADCSWRNQLCRCSKCLQMYKTKECEYLIDEKDTVQYYEAQGKAMAKNSESPFERGMSALNRMNRAAVVEALHGYDELKANLSDYLRKFADTKKVVREEDIHEFFSQLRSKKRPRLEYE